MEENVLPLEDTGEKTDLAVAWTDSKSAQKIIPLTKQELQTPHVQMAPANPPSK